MKTYIDFDGVIMDTETHLFDNYEAMAKRGLVKNDYEYVSRINFEEYLYNCDFIDGSLGYLISNPDAIILTKVCSLQEASAKVNILRKIGINNDFCFVPYGLKKDFIVDPANNILVDDTIHNLDSWVANGGKGYYFNFKNSEHDPWNNVNTCYEEITNLQQLVSKRVKK